jgi:hypothetical protein
MPLGAMLTGSTGRDEAQSAHLSLTTCGAEIADHRDGRPLRGHQAGCRRPEQGDAHPRRTN